MSNTNYIRNILNPLTIRSYYGIFLHLPCHLKYLRFPSKPLTTDYLASDFFTSKGNPSV